MSAEKHPHSGAEIFPKEFRLRTAAEFKKVYESGTRRTSRSFQLFVLNNGKTFSRFGLTTPRKLGKAHDRNRIKRRVREILRIGRHVIPPGFDFVVNPKRSTIERQFSELQEELLTLMAIGR